MFALARAEVRKIPAFPPIMIAEKAHDAAVRQWLAVNFAWAGAGREGAVPEEAEQGPFGAVAQPVSALAAHAGGSGGLCNAAAAREFVEEA